jgi:hypothetical protein
VFGSGARYGTDDAWQSVNADVRGIQPGSTLEYRLVAETAGGETWGETVRLEVPRSVVPVVVATEPRSVGVDRAVLAGRVAPMGLRTEYYFEIGRSEHSARPTSRRYAGFELSPRTVQVPVTGLDPGSPYVYRLVAVNEAGASTGPWQRLQTGK